jgi:hypothetical protein
MIDYDDGEEVGQATVIKDTGKAILCDIDGVGEQWVPQSCVHERSEVWKEGQAPGLLVVKTSFAEKQGWV